MHVADFIFMIKYIYYFRFGGVAVFDGDKAITVMCDNFDQNPADTSVKIPMNVVSTGSNLTIVLHSYLDEIYLNFSYRESTCTGLFIDPCSLEVIKGNVPVDIRLVSFEEHDVRNMHVIRYCDKAMGSSTNFMKFTLLLETVCAVFQLRTPQWQYRRSNTRFVYDCKLVLLQDHTKANVMLYYEIKSFQFENVIVLNYKSDTVKINENRQCHSAIHNSTYLRELPGYGDMLTYYFLEGHIREQTHKIVGQWCKDLSSFTRTFFTYKCNTRVLSKSHNSSLLSYYAVAERPAKLRVDYLGRFGTVSAGLRAWGASWTALKVRFTCQVLATRGHLNNICEFSKLSLCKIVKKTNRKSVLKLVHDMNKENKAHCHLGRCRSN